MAGRPLPDFVREAFCIEYVKTLSVKAAARVAGVSETQAWAWMKQQEIVDRIEGLAKRRAEIALVDAAEVLSELVRIALADPADAFTPEGALVANIHDIPVHLRKTISSIKVEELFSGRGDERAQIGTVKEIKFWDKPRGLEMLGRHLALFRDSLALTTPNDGTDDNTLAARVASIVDALRERQQAIEELL